RQDHVVTLESRPANIEGRGEVTIRDLVINCLRMRPDRIVVGEVRGGEALDMLQAMNTGHDGSLTTAHANSKILVLAKGWAIDNTGGPHFADVPTTHTFYDYVETVYKHGAIAGYNCGGPG